MSRVDGGLRAELRKRLPHFHWTSVETPLTESGVPDCEYCCEGVQAWIECKRARGWEVSLRPEQIGWQLRRHRAGGRALIAVRRVPGDELWLLAGHAARELKEYGLPRDLNFSRKPALWPHGALLGLWTGGPSRWDWRQVERALLA